MNNEKAPINHDRNRIEKHAQLYAKNIVQANLVPLRNLFNPDGDIKPEIVDAVAGRVVKSTLDTLSKPFESVEDSDLLTSPDQYDTALSLGWVISQPDTLEYALSTDGINAVNGYRQVQQINISPYDTQTRPLSSRNAHRDVNGLV